MAARASPRSRTPAIMSRMGLAARPRRAGEPTWVDAATEPRNERLLEVRALGREELGPAGVITNDSYARHTTDAGMPVVMALMWLAAGNSGGGSGADVRLSGWRVSSCPAVRSAPTCPDGGGWRGATG